MSFYYDSALDGTKAAHRILPVMKINYIRINHLRFFKAKRCLKPAEILTGAIA